jgi:Ca-activated chloride channel family protein
MEQFNSSPIDFVINYESVILNNPSKLIPVYPQEGIVTADYQLNLVTPDTDKAERYKKLVAYLKKVEVQKELVNTYKYRSLNSEVMGKQSIFDDSKLLVEMPFNPSAELSEAILDSYFNTYKKPAKFVFVVDTSGSMAGDRATNLKSSINSLLTGQISKYASIRDREEVLIIPFNDTPYQVVKFDSKHTTDMNAYVQNLYMDGGTAMFDSVSAAINELAKDKQVNGDKYRYSVIVFTDGASNKGGNAQDFQNWFQNQGFEKGAFRVFAISFGDADIKQLNAVTEITGGSVFDGKSSLAKAFRDIRSYQ